ncbi:HAMP domain-containing sensor histidine kinase [Sphingomonas sp. PB2P12]|uniref:sensor histidine kinase n=1 Tax=Sphingomonas sandaracina TaxID=3096157 RepID=UPI002FCC0BCD
MRLLRSLVPRSLYGRMLAISAISTLFALVFAGFAISHVLERFVMRGLDDRLDAQITVVARAVRPDGSLDRARIVDLAGFDSPGSGWAWQVAGPAGRVTSDGSASRPIVLPEPGAGPPRPPLEGSPSPLPRVDTQPRPGEARDRHGERLHSRTAIVASRAGPVTITAVGPRRIVEAPLREAMIPLLGSLALLGIGLALATLFQLRIGFGPLRDLRESLAAVRAGSERHIPDKQPGELRPLVIELNALIDQNAAGLAHARQHVANLAHGLKTPLAALSLKLAEAGAADDLRDMVDQIDSRVRHHLGRARADAAGSGTRARTAIAPAIDDLANVLRRVHAERPLSVDIAVPTDIAVAVDPQDLDEMVGNLLDNAWRHARTRIVVSVVVAGPVVSLTIADDGDGLETAAIGEAMMPGRRLDERGDGHGFGLSIARELAELNGGGLTLGRSAELGGLSTTLTLPIQS